jgi:hypothetical protein
MTTSSIRFYGELNDFLAPQSKHTTLSITLNDHPAVKGTIESLGVPHTEVNIITVNGKSVDFSCQLADADRVHVYPCSLFPETSPLIRLQPAITGAPRFVLDTHLGKLASYLRMLGFDALYQNDFTDDDLAGISNREDRYLLTRDRGLLKRSIVSRGYCIRSTDPVQQILEVIKRFDLSSAIRPFRRCLICNGELVRIEKEEILDRLEPETKKYCKEFFICMQCGKVYWKGSHYQRMRQFFQQLLERNIN